MTVDEVLKWLELCSTPGGGCPNECPYNIYDENGEDCSRMLKKDAMSLIMQGELNADTMKLIDDQGDMIDELNSYNKLLWRFIHSDKSIEDAFYNFYNIKRTHGDVTQ